MSPLWPAKLDHLRRDGENPDALAEFYAAALGFEPTRLDADTWLLAGFNRRLLIGKGAKGTQDFAAFRLTGPDHLAAFRAHCEKQGLHPAPNPTPLFAEGFALADPDGRTLAFGLADPTLHPPPPGAGAKGLPGRLQHVVYATQDLPRLIEFYVGKLGFRTSDDVFQGNQVTATF